MAQTFIDFALFSAIYYGIISLLCSRLCILIHHTSYPCGALLPWVLRAAPLQELQTKHSSEDSQELRRLCFCKTDFSNCAKEMLCIPLGLLSAPVLCPVPHLLSLLPVDFNYYITFTIIFTCLWLSYINMNFKKTYFIILEFHIVTTLFLPQILPDPILTASQLHRLCLFILFFDCLIYFVLPIYS